MASNQEAEPINLTVSRVNTRRNLPGSASLRSAAEELPAKKEVDLPWTVESARGTPHVLGSPMGLSSLPLFQPSPRRTPLCCQSPSSHNFGFSLEAMLNSPQCASGVGEFLLGACADGRFETPSSKMLLESMFSVTPRNKPDLHHLLKASDPGHTRGLLDLATLQALSSNTNMLENKGQSGDQEQFDAGKSRPAIPSGSPVSTSLLLAAGKQLKGSDQVISPTTQLLMSQFGGGDLDLESSLQHIFQSQLLQHQQNLDGSAMAMLKQSSGLLGGSSLRSLANPESTTDFANRGMKTEATEANMESGHSQGSANEHGSNQDLGTDAGAGPPLDPVRTCHCKKSRCLKLYCDCFAAGMFCSKCACTGCLNRPEHGATVMEKRDNIMTRDPEAFSNKILGLGAKSGKHKKGCNCKRSHCLKKYCECFQGGVKCAGHCKCLDCKNVLDTPTHGGQQGGAAAAAAAAVASSGGGAQQVLEAGAHEGVAEHEEEARRGQKRARAGAGGASCDPQPASESATIAYSQGLSNGLLLRGLGSPCDPTPCTVSSRLPVCEEPTDRQLSMPDINTLHSVPHPTLNRSSSCSVATAIGNLTTQGAHRSSSANLAPEPSTPPSQDDVALAPKDPLSMVLLQLQRVTSQKRRKGVGAPGSTSPNQDSDDPLGPSSFGGLTSSGSLTHLLTPQLPPLRAKTSAFETSPSTPAEMAELKQSALVYMRSRSRLMGQSTPGLPVSPDLHIPPLTVKAPTPILQISSRAAALANILSTTPNYSNAAAVAAAAGSSDSCQLISGKAAAAGLAGFLDAAAMLSPSLSDCFDPMQMLSSPLCGSDMGDHLLSRQRSASPTCSKGSHGRRVAAGTTKLLPSSSNMAGSGSPHALKEGSQSVAR